MTKEEVLNWIGSLFNLPDGTVLESSTKDQIPGWDSMGLLKLMSGLFEDFNVDISDTELLSLQSAQDIIDLLQRNGHIE